MDLLQPVLPLRGLALLFCRDGRVRTTTLLPEAPAVERWTLDLDPASAEATAPQRQRWLTLEVP